MVSFILVAALLLGMAPQSLAAGPEKEDGILNTSRCSLEIIVKYKDGVDSGESSAIEKEAKSTTRSSKLAGKQMIEMGGGRVDVLEIGANDDIEALLGALNAHPDVEYAQPNHALALSSLPEDAGFELQWALENTGQSIEGQVGVVGMDAGVVPVWEGSHNLSPVTVALIDTGVDAAHPDLQGKVLPGWNFVSGNSGTAPSGSETHGTHLAGIIAANWDANGVAGITTNASILPLKIFENGTAYTSDALAAIAFAEQQGSQILNCSWGSSAENPALLHAIQQSEMLFVCAAGNGGNAAPNYPASYVLPNIISIASHDNQGKLAATSSFGMQVDIAAPGAGIYSTLPGNAYGYQSGTSQAAAFASGAAALLLGCRPALTAAELKYVLCSSVQPAHALEGKVRTGGIMDVSAGWELVRDNEPIIVPEDGGGLPTAPVSEELAAILQMGPFSALTAL